MATSRIDIRKFEDDQAGFVLWSPAGNLLLVGEKSPLADVQGAIDDFTRHCGIRQCYKMVRSGPGWMVELNSVDGRRLGWSAPQVTSDDADEIIEQAVKHGPFALTPDGSPTAA